MTLTKKDQVLLKKIISAKEVKEESNKINQKSSSKLRAPSTHDGNFSIAESFPKTGNLRPLTTSQIENGRINNNFEHTQNKNKTVDVSTELSQRSLTHAGQIRKMQSETLLRIRSKDSILPSDETNRFMPKVTIRRPDGASLSAVYESKREDVWAKILQQQIAEEEGKKSRDKVVRERFNDNYGKMLNDQLVEKKKIESTMSFRDEAMVRASGTFQAFESRDMERRHEALRRKQEFVKNALDDIEFKRQIRMQEVKEELESSALLVKLAQDDLEKEKEKLKVQRQAKAEAQKKLFDENQVLQEKRYREREIRQAMERKYVQECDENLLKAEQKRKAAVQKRADSTGTERGVYQLAEKIHQEETKRKEELFDHLLKSENSLSRQLKQSEDFAKTRMNQGRTRLQNEWKKQMADSLTDHDAIRRQKQQALDEMNEVNRKLLKSQERQKKAKREAAINYQKMLDNQLHELRQKSLDSLKETMTPRERQMNADLLKKFFYVNEGTTFASS